jgi:protein SCO1/2
MTATSSTQRMLLLVLVALLAALGVVLLSSHRSGTGPATSSTHSRFNGPTLPPGLRAHDFTLTDQNGHRISLAADRGKVVVLTFIHSLCHDTCPFMVEQIKGALNDLPDTGRGIPTIGVSVAPGEDTPAHRRAFLVKHGMNGRIAFVSGSVAALKPIWHAYAMQPVTPKVDHSTFVLLIDRRGYERIGYPADELTPEGLAHDIRVLEREPA